jgi:hypothetical protein
MIRIKIGILCCMAALAVGGVSATTASAKPTWHVGIGCENDPTNKSHFEGQISAICVLFKWVAAYKYKYKIVLNPPATITRSTYTESFTDAAFSITVSCSVSEEGKIGPESADELTKLTAKECKSVEGGCTSPSAEPLHLPWTTELYEPVSEEFRDKIESSGAGVPGWKLSCTILGVKATDTCEGETNVKVNDGEGDVEESFDSKSPKVNCSLGGKEEGSTGGTVTVGPISSTEELFVE